jgi:hypothetical protein
MVNFTGPQNFPALAVVGTFDQAIVPSWNDRLVASSNS